MKLPATASEKSKYTVTRVGATLAVLLSFAAVRPAWAILDIEDNGPVLNAGGFSLRVTNAGIFGNAFLDKGLSFDPSFEIQPGSGLEALNHAELWVGALDERGAPRVSGGPLLEWRPTLDSNDRVRGATDARPGTRRFVDDDGDGSVDEELLDDRDNDGDGEIDEDLGLFSQQMMAADFVDDRPEALYSVYEGGEGHIPLHLAVHQEAYAWSTAGYDGIAGIGFTITNRGSRTIEDVRVGLFADLDSRLRDDRAGHLNDKVAYRTYQVEAFEGLQTLSGNGLCIGGGSAPTGCNPYVCAASLSQTLPIVYDEDPLLPAVAVVPLSHTTDPIAGMPPIADHARAPWHVQFTTTVFAHNRIPGQGGPPAFDHDRYDALAGRFPASDAQAPGDYVVLVACGPFARLAPGQSVEFHVALVATQGLGTLDSLMARAALLERGQLTNAIPDVIPSAFPDEWNNGISGRTGHEACIEAPPGTTFVWDPHCPEKFATYYNFEEIPSEIPVLYLPGQCVWTDVDCDPCTGVGGNETRIFWLDPGHLPVAPSVRVIPGDHAMRIAWDNRPEILIRAGVSGPASGRFVGYRLYKLVDWRGRRSLLPPRDNWALIAAYGDDIRNGQIPLASITDTTLDYERVLYEQKLFPSGRYAAVDSEVLNGFDYAYFVAAVVEADAGSVRPLRFESPFTPSFAKIVQPHAAAKPRAGDVWVVPNPFRAKEVWQRPPVLGDQLTRHLDFMGLPRARSTIKIWTVAGDHVVTLEHDGTNGDGEAAWNLVSRNGQEVESGIYMFTVDSPLGQQVGKFVVIR